MIQSAPLVIRASHSHTSLTTAEITAPLNNLDIVVESQQAEKKTACRLPLLPAELRNNICRYTLTTPEDIIIRPAADPIVEPGLLRTCRARGPIRRYRHPLSGEHVLFPCTRAQRHLLRRLLQNIFKPVRVPPDRCHDSGSRRIVVQHSAVAAGFWYSACKGLSEASDDYDRAHKAACHVFTVVRKMRDDGMGGFWEDVAFILENTRPALEANGASWLLTWSYVPAPTEKMLS